MKKSFSYRWIQKPFILLAALFAFSSAAFGQAKYISIIGDNGCSYPSNTDYDHTLSCLVAPSSATLSSMNYVTDLSADIFGFSNPSNRMLYTSQYDDAGTLLFTVNPDGIYDPTTGLSVYGFNTYFSYVVPAGCDSGSTGMTLWPSEAASEICIVPMPGHPNSYYAIFWSSVQYAPYNPIAISYDNEKLYLRAVEIDVDPMSGSINISQDVVLNPTLDCSNWNYFHYISFGAFGVAANAPNCDNSIDIYTIMPDHNTSGYYGTILKWHIDAAGNLPDYTSGSPVYTTVSTANTLLVPGVTKTKLFQVPNSGGTYTPVLAYAGIPGFGVSSPTNASELQTVNLNTGEYHEYNAPGLTAPYPEIWGFEFLPNCTTTGAFIFSYYDPTIPGGSLGYSLPATGSSGSSSAITPIASTGNYASSDLELDYNGDLLAVYCNSYSGLNPLEGELAYIPAASLTSTSFPAPTVLTASSCSSYTSVYNFMYLPQNDAGSFYLGSQYRNPMGTHTPLQITDVDINTLCIPGTVSTTVCPLPAYSTTVVGGIPPYSYSWTPMEMLYPGPVFLSINFATLNSYTVATPTVTAVTNPYYSNFNLVVTDANGCTASRVVHTLFNDSLDFDLASRDSYFDMLDEPNSQRSYNYPASGTVWESQDIWNRYYNDGITTNQSPEFLDSDHVGTSNYLYVEVRNVGCYPLPPSDGTGPLLHTYWTLGGVGGTESWSTDWTTATVVSGTATLPIGQEIGTGAPIFPLAAGSSVVMMTPWNPPNPTQYPGNPDFLSLCFLSRIVDDHNKAPGYDPPGMTFLETGGDPLGNILNNNNIATMNTGDLVVSKFDRRSGLVRIGNSQGIRQTSLQVANNYVLQPGTGTTVLSSYAYFKLYLGDLFDVWYDAGAYGTYTTFDAIEKSVTFNGSNTIQLDSIPIDSGATYFITVANYLKQGVDGTQMPQEQFSIRQLNDSIPVGSPGNICGNYTFTVKYQAANPPGAMAVTEVSQGPALDGGATGCEYAEMIVANSGSDASEYVDLSGWILDDNANNFDSAGCILNGTTQGHYRLAYNSIWQNVQVGSIIVAYNAAVNCYNLSDTFRFDTANNIYWVPINTAASTGYSAAYVERFAAAENLSTSTSICSDTGTTVYIPANEWGETIALAAQDAIQVRCPGCSVIHPGTPPFYHGIGYAPDSTYCFATIPAGTNSVGGPVVFNSGSNLKFVFTGNTAADLGNPEKWTVSSADAAGVPPATLGNVNSAFYANVNAQILGLPLCSEFMSGERKSPPIPKTTTTEVPNTINPAQSIKVYPNPVNMSLYFVYPPSGTVTIKLMDITGRIMDEQILQNSSSTSFNVHGYTPGLYMYQVITNGITQSGKFVVE